MQTRTFIHSINSARLFYTSATLRRALHVPVSPAAQNDINIPLALKDPASTEGIIPEDFKEAHLGIRAQWSIDDLVENENDTSSAGHLYLLQQRQNLHYLRLIEHEMPNLVAFRKPFIPPTSETPLVVRSVSYGGEEHPVTVKRAVTVAVSQLPLKDKHAIYKFRLLAGVRWTPTPPKDSGLQLVENAKHGYVKISCEDFPEPAMNLKWVSDRLDDLINEANNDGDRFKDIPVDRRHLEAKVAKIKSGKLKQDIAGGVGRYVSPPSIKDFPKSWLPQHSD
ncbi:mitochondrial ribosomal subunit protein-domain-containing protein [Multifurca ochricompacta]|uniref:Mitochondrial ribosomal subunit protein-domain-containing protein n=1 Tax=Multifurca ochricompacta TaxID=376703 RepID=A0AAD4MG11_9AGAM|nr:mitochondrial ribosomal subunit protein-domain-containing protein [Multifurca ochricompacta]